MTTDLSLKAEHECVSYYLCLINEDVETKYHNLGEQHDQDYWMHRFNDILATRSSRLLR